MRELAGRIALVTGAASGIGLGIAQACAEAGMQLVLCDIDADRLAAVRDRFAADGHRVDAVPLDVADPGAWQAVADHVRATAGRLHLLCNNAGITGSGRPLAELDPREWRGVLDINLGSVFLGVRALLPLMTAHGDGGHIVNTASMAALLPYAGGAAYAASKAAMLAVSEVLEQELADRRIGVSVLLPAQVRTRLFETTGRQLDADAADAMAGLRDAARQSLARDGLDPFDVGRQVIAAVREPRFFIFTHPQLHDAVAQRSARMLDAMR